jgi:hypothetical protein
MKKMISTKILKKNKSGTTLIEILIYVALLTTILGLITNFLYQVANFRVNNQVDSSLFQNSSFAINKICQDIRLAEEVISPVDSNFSNSLILTTASGQVSYQVNDGILTRNGVDLTDNQVEVNLTPGDRGFRKIGNSVQLVINIKPKIKPFGQTQPEKTYQTTVFLKNNL